MLRFLDRCRRCLELQRYRRNIGRALALHLRGEARRDGLTPDHIRCRLEIHWRARDIHPWDRQCALGEREALFAEQALTDTEVAVHRLFEQLPYIDVIELSVVEPASENPIAQGIVDRSTLNALRPGLKSVGMRLRELGIHYCFAAREKGVPNESEPAGQLCIR